MPQRYQVVARARAVAANEVFTSPEIENATTASSADGGTMTTDASDHVVTVRSTCPGTLVVLADDVQVGGMSVAGNMTGKLVTPALGSKFSVVFYNGLMPGELDLRQGLR